MLAMSARNTYPLASPMSPRHHLPRSAMGDLPLSLAAAACSCHGAGKGHRGEIGVWVQMLVKHFIKQQKRQQAKNRTENRVRHHRRQHSAGVLESREQND